MTFTKPGFGPIIIALDLHFKHQIEYNVLIVPVFRCRITGDSVTGARSMEGAGDNSDGRSDEDEVTLTSEGSTNSTMIYR